MKWTELETLKFVNIYLRHEHLWNPIDPGYKCRNKRQEAYRDIITGFRSATGILLDEVDLRVKIKNLRSTYTQEVAKIRQRSGPDFVYTPSIKWFSDWHKCFTSIKQRMYGSLDHHGGINNTNENIWMQNELEEHLPPLVSQSDCATLKIEASSPEREQNPYKIKKKKLKHRKCSLTYQNADSTVMEDEFEIYGKYIASQLRSMDLQRALRVQLDIHSIVSEARMSSLAEN